MRNGERFVAILMLLGCGCGATRVSLAPSIPTPSQPVAGGGKVAVARQADGLPDTIGRATITVFAIPTSSVQFGDPDTAERIMRGLRATLRKAGYQPIDPADLPLGPVLTCRIKEMSFKNYTWFMPAIITWGTIRLTLALSDPTGAVRWQRDYEGHYSDTEVGEGFDEAVNTVMGRILARAAEDFTSSEFSAACCGLEAAAISLGGAQAAEPAPE